jgi:hypothetical protein
MLTPDRRLETLAPIFRHPFEAWLREAQQFVNHVEFRVRETRRNLERQRWLYAQGREDPYLTVPEVTWTMDSRHRWGLAADIAMIRKSTGDAIWEVSSWRWLYRVVPLEPYGLRSIAPHEWVHIELLYADNAIRDADLVGIYKA